MCNLIFLRAFETIFLEKHFAISKGNKGWLKFFFGKEVRNISKV